MLAIHLYTVSYGVSPNKDVVVNAGVPNDCHCPTLEFTVLLETSTVDYVDSQSEIISVRRIAVK
jgi:hypothetical protein